MKKKHYKILFISASVIIVVLLSLFILDYNRAQQDKKQELAMIESELTNLEGLYLDAIKEIEGLPSEEFVNKKLLSDLHQIVENIETEIKFIETSPRQALKDIERLNRRKNVFSAAIFDAYSKKLVKDPELVARIEKLKEQVQVLERILSLEKGRNVRLTDRIASLSDSISKFQGTTTELNALKAEYENLSDSLIKNAELISMLNQQYDNLLVNERKVSLNCYFIFREGSDRRAIRVFLTENGLSKRYLNYFLGKGLFQGERPDVFAEFKINPALFNNEVEKVELKVYDANETEIHHDEIAVETTDISRTIPAEKFSEGTYSIGIFWEGENILAGERYIFAINALQADD